MKNEKRNRNIISKLIKIRHFKFINKEKFFVNFKYFTEFFIFT